MALGPRLDIRQTQSLVMTPQLQQAIKLLALSNLEIETFVAEALESNPLLEMGEVRREAGEDSPAEPSEHDSAPDFGGEGALDVADHALDPEAAPGDFIHGEGGDWSRGDIASGAELPDLEIRSSGSPTLSDHLASQIGLVAHDEREALIALRIIGELDEAGYLLTDLRQVADELGIPLAEAERALTTVQSLDPTGVGARSLAECLALQAREADRYDPCMARLIDNLHLVAAGDIGRLKRMCEVDDEDFADMLAELRSYDPKPGLAHAGGDEGEAVVGPVRRRHPRDGDRRRVEDVPPGVKVADVRAARRCVPDRFLAKNILLSWNPN